jgi:hypothetical protein
MHAYIYTMHKRKLRRIEKKETKCSVYKWWPCNSRHEHLKIQSNYGGFSP